MEFFAHKSELLDELDLLQGAAEKRSTVPILSHFLLDAADFKLQVAATDLELGARSSCAAKVKAPGRATVPARRLVEIIRSLPDGEIHFRLLENHWVQVACQRSSFKLVAWERIAFRPYLPTRNPLSRCPPRCWRD